MSTNSPIAKEYQFNSAVTAMAFNRDDDLLCAATADGTAHIVDVEETIPTRTLQLHKGATLCLEAGFGGTDFIGGGEDGRLMQVDAYVQEPVAQELAVHKGKWIEHVAVAPTLGQVFFSAGKDVIRLRRDGMVMASWTLPSTAGGLALHPQEKRVAASHYNGVSVFPLNTKHAQPLKLNWKGSHLGIIWNPDGEIVVTSMQDEALHGWRLQDQEEMRMSGYEARVDSMTFMDGGRYLATAGAKSSICWPFFNGGPWGKKPLVIGPDRGVLISLLAAHPGDPLLAMAYEDGAIGLTPLSGEGTLPLLEATNDKLTSLLWNAKGDALFAGTENGKLYKFTLDSVSAAFKR